MKRKPVFGIFALTVLCALIGCGKTSDRSSDRSKESEGPKKAEEQGAVVKVEGVKVTNDIDSTFKVQALMTKDMWTPGNTDLGIIGAIEDGKLTISVPEPTEEMLWPPGDNDFGCETEGMKISELRISTSKASVVLDQSQSGITIGIWYANKAGVVDFLGDNRKVSLEAGWNFVENSPNARVWTSLQDVYEEGYYKWKLVDTD